MKVYSIGREKTCDIVMTDNTDVVSRRHAILTVYPSGKMTITDQSQNGTYVNGMRITPNSPVPVTRKDNVSLAHVATLDWNRVPKQVTILQYVLIAVIVIIVIGGGIWAYSNFSGGGEEPEMTVATQDTTATKSVEQIKAELQDSINREKAKADSIENAKKKEKKDKEESAKPKPKPVPTPKDSTKTEKKDSTATRIR